MEKRKISLAITTYNRPELTVMAFEKVLHDERVSEIVILDDASDLDSQSLLCSNVIELKNDDKIKLYINDANEGMSLAKKKAIELCENDGVIIFDSDNKIDSSYINALYKIDDWNKNTIYCPAKGYADYSEFVGFIDLNCTKWLLNTEQKFNWFANTGNYFVNRETYLKNYVYNPEIKQADTIWHMYNHLRNGGNFFIAPNMSYEHLIHDGSGWKQNRKENVKKFKEIKGLIGKL